MLARGTHDGWSIASTKLLLLHVIDTANEAVQVTAAAVTGPACAQTNEEEST